MITHRLRAPESGAARLILAIILSFVVAAPSAADTVHAVFTLDPTQSYLTLFGMLEGALPVVEQTPGSTQSFATGTMNVQIDRTAGAWTGIVFEPTNDVRPIPLAGPFRPGNSGADFAGQVDLSLIQAGLIGYGVIRDSVIDFHGGTQPIDGAGQFPVFGLDYTTTSTLDYDIGQFGVGSERDTFSGPIDQPTTATLAQAGNLLTLTMPLDFTVPAFSSQLNLNIDWHFVGQFVATANVPEPTSAAIALSALAGFASVLCRRAVRARRGGRAAG